MLETIWFLLWGVLWAVYFVLDGFDLGLGSLMLFLAKNETDKRIIYNAMGPFWNGNEVWLITAGGVTFAAFPTAYAVMFSSLYSPLMLLLFSLIMRGVSFEFRGKSDHPVWKSLWDGCMVIGSFLPALLFGVAFANIFHGIPIDRNGVYHGTLLTLLSPYGLVGGFLFLFLFLEHGALWLAIKSDGPLHERAGSTAARIWPVLVAFAVSFLVFTLFWTNLYKNYLNNPVLFLVPLLTVSALLLIRVYIVKASWWKAWFASSLTIAGATLFGVIGLYPNLLPSSLDQAYSLTIHNSSSSSLTLKIMLVVALIFVPIVIFYQGWVYRLFKGKVNEEELTFEESY